MEGQRRGLRKALPQARRVSRLGVELAAGVTRFAVRAPAADAVWLCCFDDAGEARHPMIRQGPDWVLELPGNLAGLRYGYRAAGEWAPSRGLWFDPAKLLVDPRAVELDRRFVQDPRLIRFGEDTADLVPRAVVPAFAAPVSPEPARFVPGGLVYEVNVRAFTRLHPDVPEDLRGTVAALAHPAVLAHLKKLHITAVELMPVVAWIDERHLPPLGLVNAWGYNPVAMMALDPGLCPGGVAELRATVAALHSEGIGVVLDLVFNHSGESDVDGGVLSLRGLDNATYVHTPDGTLINDTGCGNTLDFANPAVRDLVLDAMRHFVTACGVDGFRFDLAPVLARGPGFDPAAPIFAEIAADPLLATRVMIAEPWDVGPGGYQLGNFPGNWLEWNDRYRDDVRRFWRGDGGIGTLATRLAGSSDVFGPVQPGAMCRSVNFLAAHDGFTLADTVSYESRHNWANGEDNRDGHGENFSWNHGVEGESRDPSGEELALLPPLRRSGHVAGPRRADDDRGRLGTAGRGLAELVGIGNPAERGNRPVSTPGGDQAARAGRMRLNSALPLAGRMLSLCGNSPASCPSLAPAWPSAGDGQDGRRCARRGNAAGRSLAMSSWRCSSKLRSITAA